MFLDPKRKSAFQIEIDKLLSDLSDYKPTDDEYGVILERMSELYKMRSEDRPRQPSPDTMLLAATNILGILLIINYERLSVVPRNAFSLLMRR